MARMSIREMLQKKEEELMLLIKKAQEYDDPSLTGNLEIMTIKGKTRYYQSYRDDQGKKHRKYLSPSKEAERIAGLAQAHYNKSFLKTALKQLKAVREALEKMDDKSLANVYGLLHNERKKLINPFVQDDEGFVKAWEDDHYTPGYFDKAMDEIYSERDERVRSKSEKIIADRYYRLGIPYKYEKPLILVVNSQFVTVRPDFTLLNRRTRQQFYHEHLGKMNDPKYVKKNINKIKWYEMNGIFLGEQLYLTFELEGQSLDMKYLNTLIEHYLT